MDVLAESDAEGTIEMRASSPACLDETPMQQFVASYLFSGPFTVIDAPTSLPNRI